MLQIVIVYFRLTWIIFAVQVAKKDDIITVTRILREVILFLKRQWNKIPKKFIL